MSKCCYCPRYMSDYHCQQCNLDFCNECLEDHIQVFPEHEVWSNNIGADLPTF